ncbi:MAG TPA: SurA N-terminal domain-containing protein [Bacteroidia bacterium]|jgi:peptidyl-prolyl cis-trans isomerase D|nr:SurA N-terminal domain-containing protein [Bacteroidia bacterium]
MSVLESLRKRSGLLVAFVGIALLAFVLTGLFQRDNSFFGSDNSIGEIAGKSIDVKEFKERYDQAVDRMKQGSEQPLDQNQLDNIVQQTWNQLINEQVMEKEYEKLGIAVSDEELYDIMMVHPHQALIRNITDQRTGKVYPVFADEAGEVSPAKMRQYVQGMKEEQEQEWAQVEKYVRQYRLSEKYNEMIKKGLYVTKAAAKSIFNAQNINSDVKYVTKSYNTIADSLVKPTDDELNTYYKAHQNEFKQETSRKIEYVAFTIAPSPEDIADAKKEMQETANQFKEKKTGEDSSFVVAQSASRHFDVSFHPKGTLSPEIDTIMFKSEPGTVVGPYLENGSFQVAKLIAVKTAADSAKVRHILIAYAGSGASEEITRTKEQAKKEADSLLAVLKKDHSKFPEFVEKYSDDRGKKMPPNKKEGEDYPGKGGDYGWLNANSGFVEPFKNAGLDGKKGDLLVVESQFGYHIMEVLDAKGSQKKVQVATIDKKLEPSNRTMQAIYVQASDFAGKSTTEELFKKGAGEQNLERRPAVIKENDRNIQGLESAKPLIKWAYDNKKGTVSEPLVFGDKYVVAVITDVREKGIATLEQAKEEVIAKVTKEKKAQQISKELEPALASGSIDAVSAKAQAPVMEAQNVNFSMNALPAQANEPGVIGQIVTLKPQTLSKPIVGKEGVYVAYVTARREAPAPKDYNAQQRGAMVEAQVRVDYEVYNALRENANIKEHFLKFGY